MKLTLREVFKWRLDLRENGMMILELEEKYFVKL